MQIYIIVFNKYYIHTLNLWLVIDESDFCCGCLWQLIMLNIYISHVFHHILLSSVQLLSCVQLCDPIDCSTPGFPVHHQLQELAQTHVHRVGDAIQPSRPLLSPSPPAFHVSRHQGLSQCQSFPAIWIMWPKYWSFSSSPSNEYSGLISFRIDWFGLLAVQGTLKSLLQHHSSKASFSIQPSLWSISHIYTWLWEKP